MAAARTYRYSDEHLMDLIAHPVVPLELRCKRLTFGAWAERKAIVHQRSGGRCAYCGIDARRYPICDHLTPISRGGTNDFSNLVTACDPCNLRKGMLTAEEYRRKISDDIKEDVLGRERCGA